MQPVQKGRGRGGKHRIRDNSSGWKHARSRTKMAMCTAAICRYRTDSRVLSQFKPIRPIFRRAHRLISLNYYVNKRPCLTRRWTFDRHFRGNDTRFIIAPEKIREATLARACGRESLRWVQLPEDGDKEIGGDEMHLNFAPDFRRQPFVRVLVHF